MKMTRDEVAKTIENFVNGTGGTWDWDDFLSIRLQDAELDAIRKKCASVRDEFPPPSGDRQYCSDAGTQVLREFGDRIARPLVVDNQARPHPSQLQFSIALHQLKETERVAHGWMLLTSSAL